MAFPERSQHMNHVVFGKEEWMEQGACVGDPYPDDWFPAPNDHHTSRRALNICYTCPVRLPCYNFGKQFYYGIWGGVWEGEWGHRAKTRK